MSRLQFTTTSNKISVDGNISGEVNITLSDVSIDGSTTYPGYVLWPGSTPTYDLGGSYVLYVAKFIKNKNGAYLARCLRVVSSPLSI